MVLFETAKLKLAVEPDRKNYKNWAHRPIIVTIILVLRKPLINHLDESPDIIKAANFDKNLAISLKTV